MQAYFICLAHNLMLIVERYLQQNGIENKKEDDRRRAILESDLLSKPGLIKEKLPAFLKTPRQATQRSLKFIRWLPQPPICKHFMGRSRSLAKKNLCGFLTYIFGHRCLHLVFIFNSRRSPSFRFWIYLLKFWDLYPATVPFICSAIISII